MAQAGRRLVGTFAFLLLLQAADAAHADDADVVSSHIETWQLTTAASMLADPKIRDALPPVARVLLEAELAFRRSEFKTTARLLTRLVADHPEQHTARVLLGRALLASGDDRSATRVLDVLADRYEKGRLKSTAELRLLGISLQLNGYFKDANRAFREAIEQDRRDLGTRLAWGRLFHAKYNYRDADRLVKEVLAALGKDRGALWLEARLLGAHIALESDRAVAEARAITNEIIATYPECIPAQNLMARLELEDERPEDAIARLRTHSLGPAPADPTALALLASAHAILDDTPSFMAVEKLALRANPRNSNFYAIVATQIERVHRYREAIAIAEKGLRLRANDADLLAIVATGHSRLGNDKLARTNLDKAHKRDPYHVKVFNLLAHFYDRVDKRFTWLDAGDMRIRADRNEAQILELFVPDLLAQARTHLSATYGIKPKAPLHIEIFPDPETFAIRSIGLPRLAAHGICFGHVITARSPSAGDFNWAEVLWHELAHVYHLQLSDNRVPRWFTEGLALLDSVDGRPAWAREMDTELHAALMASRLRGISDFNLAFTQARNLNDILVAYHQAYQVLRFIRSTFGPQSTRDMLVAWGKRQRTADVVRNVLGLEPAAFDQRFFAWLQAELAWVARANPFQLQLSGTEADRRITEAGPAEAADEVLVHAAAAALATNRRQQALGIVSRFFERTSPNVPPETHALAHYVRGTLHLQDDEPAAARDDLLQVEILGFAGVEVQRALSELAQKAGDLDSATRHLAAAADLNPQDVSLLNKLAKLQTDAGRQADAFATRRRIVAIDQSDTRNLLILLSHAADHGASVDDIQTWIEQAVFVRPFDLKLHDVIANTATKAGLTALADRSRQAAARLRP